MSKLLRTIEIVAKRLNPSLKLTGVVLCMYESATRLAAEVSRDVEDFFKAHTAHQGRVVWSQVLPDPHPAEYSISGSAELWSEHLSVRSDLEWDGGLPGLGV